MPRPVEKSDERASGPVPESGAAEPLQRAIKEQLLVSVRYNRGRSLLAPYTIFSRHGERYLRAVTVARDGNEPSRLKLGTFKLCGLSEMQVVPVPFSPTELYRQVEQPR